MGVHKFELIMAKRGWRFRTNDLTLFVFGIEDAMLVTQNITPAGESIGLGSCLSGYAMYRAGNIAKAYCLPPKVFPIAQLVTGYPVEDPPTRPRYPLKYTLFEGRYPELTDEMVTEAMETMDDGHLLQDYYRKGRSQIRLEGSRKEKYSYEDYSWTEHICRKWGQWNPDAAELLHQMKMRGFRMDGGSKTS